LTAPAPIDLERRVITAAVLWVGDQGCSLALACLEEAVADYLTARATAPTCPPRQSKGDPEP
jgi:hypothetical protein